MERGLIGSYSLLPQYQLHDSVDKTSKGYTFRDFQATISPSLLEQAQ